MTESKDDLGDRMKGYERIETGRIIPRTVPMVARIDGRSFSGFTRDLPKPFDSRMAQSMRAVTKNLMQESNADLGYTQSDEITLVWDSVGEETNTERFFGGKLLKLTSVLASIATAHFHLEMRKYGYADMVAQRCPVFDCRVWGVPDSTEAANALVWRILDAKKNGISSATRAHYSHGHMRGKGQAEMLEMMKAVGVDYEADFSEQNRLGSLFRVVQRTRLITKEEMDRIPASKRLRDMEPYEITRREIEEIPASSVFNKENRLDYLFHGEDPIEQTETV